MISNSKEVQKRIKKFYGRDSIIIYPPVELAKDLTEGKKDNMKPPFYLALGRLAAYKNFNLLVQAFNLLGWPLVIAGTGKEEKALKKYAKANITFTGAVTEYDKAKYMSTCEGFIFPVVDEDFGITVVEAMSYGKPILAHRSGGPLETIREGRDGMFFDEPKLDSFVEKLKEFDKNVRGNLYKADDIREHVQMYNKERFKNEFYKFVMDKYLEYSPTNSR